MASTNICWRRCWQHIEPSVAQIIQQTFNKMCITQCEFTHFLLNTHTHIQVRPVSIRGCWSVYRQTVQMNKWCRWCIINGTASLHILTIRRAFQRAVRDGRREPQHANIINKRLTSALLKCGLLGRETLLLSCTGIWTADIIV